MIPQPLRRQRTALPIELRPQTFAVIGLPTGTATPYAPKQKNPRFGSEGL